MPHITIDGTEIFYDLTGPTEATVIAFSNSLGTTLEMWDGVARVLAGRFRLLRYDTCGHGRSGLGKGRAEIEAYAADLAGLLTAFGIERAHIVGLSLGGMVAQALAIGRPERVASLSLLATAPHLPPPDNWLMRAKTVRAQGMRAIVEAVLGRWFSAGFAAAEPALYREWRGRLLGIDAEGYASACEAIGGLDLRAGLKSLTAPTLVVAGRDDPVTTVAMGEALAAAIPGAKLAVVERAAHLLAVERPQEVAEILAGFIGGLAGAGRMESAEARFAQGLAIRKSVLGVEHVQRSLAKAGAFAMPWQETITRNAWREIWGDPTIPWKTRSMVTLAMMVALHREEEFKLHVRPALKNGVTLAELQALLLQTGIYAGVPAANAAFRWVREVLGDEADKLGGE
jgi:3-oxoadipate enol-lactonase / 4-carboxymuconolactone decarboxylase